MSNVQVGDQSVQPPQVGIWFMDDGDEEWAGLQCDGCGGISVFRRFQLPVELGRPCIDCGAIATHVAGRVDDSGRVSMLTPDEALQIARYLVAA